MTQPSVDTTELQFALGILPASAGKLYALIGVSEKGPIATPSTYGGSPTGLVADFGRGPMVEAAAHYMEKYGKPVVVVRTTGTTPGSYLDAVEGAAGEIGAITKTGTGSCTYSDNASDPLVEADVVVLFAVGGTRGTAGIVYQISLDNGATWGPPLALGTATHIDIGTTGASVAVSAGTVVAGDFISFHLTAPIEASAGEVVTTGTVGGAPTTAEATHPLDDYEVKILFVTGGTRGTPGITYKWSLDDGRTYSAIVALGTSTYIELEDGTIKINLAAGVYGAGATIPFPTVAPKWNTTDLGVALTALKNAKLNWGIGHVVGPCDADDATAIDLAFSGMLSAGKFHESACSTRLPIGDESEATYRASLAADFSEFATVCGAVCAGAIETVSSVSGRKYRRPLSFTAIAREAASSEEVDTADVNLGPLPVTKITDSLGNPKHHDESVNPGLDDARFYVARTWEDYEGVYVNRPRIMSVDGSDFEIMPHRRVMNVGRAATRSFLIKRLNQPIQVDPVTGFILEAVALEIESGGRHAMETALLAKPKASAVVFRVGRTDNLLAKAPMTVTDRVVPLAYVETILEEVGFLNPANVTS